MGYVYALIVEMPGSGTEVEVYGTTSDRAALEQEGHLLCDGSAGWSFVVVPWPLPAMQPAEFGSM